MRSIEEAEIEADEYRRLVHRRTGIEPRDLVCPRETSAMTPCIARDGALAVADEGLCVGCGVPVVELLRNEREKNRDAMPEEGGDADST